MRKVHSRTRNNRARKLKNVEREKLTLYHMKYGEKHRKLCKMRNTHCRTWNMARNSQKREEGEIHTVEPGLWREN